VSKAIFAAMAALLVTVGGCTSGSTEDANGAGPSAAASATADTAFGEWATLGEGITVMVGSPEEFTPSTDVYAQPIWGPVELEEWEHFVRAAVTVRNESGDMLGLPVSFATVAEPSYAEEVAGNSVESQSVVDEASGIREAPWPDLPDGEEVSFDVGFGVEVEGEEELLDLVRISVSTGPTVTSMEQVVVFGP
jgi:hypothetical protein